MCETGNGGSLDGDKECSVDWLGSNGGFLCPKDGRALGEREFLCNRTGRTEKEA